MFYAIKMLKRYHDNSFMNYDWAMAHGGIHASDYETVWRGNITDKGSVTATLEAIYTLFNTIPPEGYENRCLCVSDLVVLDENEITEASDVYFCDSIGFKKLN